MKKTTYVVVCACLCVAWAGAVVCAAAAENKGIVPAVDAKKHEVVRLHYISGINRPEVVVTPGTTVIWVNGSRAPVDIQFTGTQVALACKNPVHFVTGENGSFVSDRIPEGSVASLCFVEKGEYPYRMRKSIRGGEASGHYRGAEREFTGKVIVQ